ncbi:glycosyl hydrolase family 43 [Motilibacter peucedani]|uniref:Glycosyl hydrolase family 43 n=1 Tax=Motilibacter peucedani TaxID=598650 RepID=A0A420XNI2_9ACTN|nr:family 43 glycosylhydrolase [Motilibacter peucedani]RKS73738.1 glycosyl hydrolase family 43 [Motilibacter peucedani]
MGLRAALAVTATLALCAVGAATPAGAAPASRPSGPYVNPVLHGVADTFADPSVIRGKDGWWYAYGTSDPLREGEGTPHWLPIVRSKDLVRWTHVGDAFTATTLPSWADTAPGLGLWAPDIRYVDGEYRLYYVVTQTTVSPDRDDNAIGMATAPTPAGPWTDSGAPVVAPRGNGGPGNYLWTFDPDVVTDADGSQHIVYGSYYGGLWTAPLDPSGRRTTGPATQIAIDNKFEGAYLVHRSGWWYLFASTANCCAGPTTGYSVQVGRSRSITGPFVDAQGISLMASRTGGTPVLRQNGNRWIGTGHNALLTDLTGQDWIVYHAIDRGDPWLDEPGGINQRPMLMDRLDWVGGWPVVDGGAGPSDSRERPPVVVGNGSTDVSTGFSRWRGSAGWQVRSERDSGAYAVAPAPASLLFPTGSARARVEADVRGTATTALTVRAERGGWAVSARLVPSTSRLELVAGGRRTSVALPAGFAVEAWHSVVLQVKGTTAYADVSSARLGDPVATLTLPAAAPTGSGWYSGGVVGTAGSTVDNISALPIPSRPLELEPPLRLGRLDASRSDEFTGSAIDPSWTQEGGPVPATVSGGSLVWPTEAGDLVGPGDGGTSLLLRDVPGARWVVETKLTNDFGVDTVRNFQQGGLVVYAGPDEFVRLSNVAIFNTRQVEFGQERSFAGLLSWGGSIVGPPGATTWLRIASRASGSERLLTAYSSNDGATWVRGATWTLPLADPVRVGLLSQSGAGGLVSFDWFCVYR